MTAIADAPFEIVGWDVNRGGEIRRPAHYTRQKAPGALNTAHTQSSIGLVAVQISGETGMRRLFSC
jgi:hypothetical protein